MFVKNLPTRDTVYASIMAFTVGALGGIVVISKNAVPTIAIFFLFLLNLVFSNLNEETRKWFGVVNLIMGTIFLAFAAVAAVGWVQNVNPEQFYVFFGYCLLCFYASIFLFSDK